MSTNDQREGIPAGFPLTKPATLATQDAAGYAPPATQGETGFPNIEAIASGTISGRFSEWPLVKPEAARLLRELSEAKTLYAAALDTLKDMSAQVAQLTGAQDRMDAEIAMLTADLFRATSERCAENDRERAAHLQAYQAVTRERDEARQDADDKRHQMSVYITAAEAELAELRKDRELLDCVDSSTEIQVIGGRNEFDQPFWIAQHRHKTQTIDCAGKSARDAIRCLMNRLASIDAARKQQENRE